MSRNKSYWVIILLFAFISTNSYSAEPPSLLKLTIPDYKITRVGNLDYVKIPEGEVLLIEEGRPMVPYYIKTIDYPKDYRVQEVILKRRSGLRKATGLNLPVVILGPRPKVPIEMKKGLYPQKEYNWKVLENPDGSTTLVISLYPFYYDPATTEVSFYKDYELEIKYIHSALSIISFTIDKDVYDPGDRVMIDLGVNNPGKPQDVVVKTTLREYGSDRIVDSLPVKSLKDLAGEGSISIEWNSKGFDPGFYYVEVALNDTSGNLLDKETERFRLGRPLIEITHFTVEPKHFSIGDSINFSMRLKNTGSMKTTGDAIFRIQESGKVVKEFRHGFKEIAPGSSLDFNNAWDTKEAKKGAIYYILGYVRYEAQATPPMREAVSTNHFPVPKFTYSPERPLVDQEISFDASGSSDTDGQIVSYKWDFGDYGITSGKVVTYAYSKSGEYQVTLTVEDNEGARNTTSQVITISDGE